MNNLEDAMELDVHLVSDYPRMNQLTHDIFNEVCERLYIRNKPRSKETLKLVIINLWLSFQTGTPIRYSRRSNSYLAHQRYGKLHIKYKRIIAIVDTLETLDFVYQKKGFFDRSKGIGRQTRLMPAAKLISRFESLEACNAVLAKKSPPEETIQLKDEEKNLVDYPNTRSTKDMRCSLRRYNEFINKQRVEVSVPAETEINARFLMKLKLNALKGRVDFTVVKSKDKGLFDHAAKDRFLEPYEIMEAIVLGLPTTTSGKHATVATTAQTGEARDMQAESCQMAVSVDNNKDYEYEISISNHHHTNKYEYDQNSKFLINISTMTDYLRTIEDEKTRKTAMLGERALADFGFESLQFHSRYQHLHRVFNNGSFKQGGRFYGAFHLEMPKELRKRIYINGERTVELDYSALHIRMLYHMENIDYREDPYAVLCENPEERAVYKIVQLVAINAESESDAVMGIRDRLRTAQIEFDLTNSSIQACLEKFKKVHSKISRYLSTGIGLRLQNLDGRITDKILSSLTKTGIPCLPVHDSYIVRETDEELLRDLMMEHYEEAMGFLPVIGQAKGGGKENDWNIPHWLFDNESDVPEFEEFPG